MENQEKSDVEPEVEEVPEFKGKNLEDAILHAEHKLKVPRTEFEYEVVTEKTRLFGLGKEVVIWAKIKRAGKSGDMTVFLDRLMNVFPLELTYEIKTKDDINFVVFGGADKQLLLWKDGALLLAIQHLLNKISDEKSRWIASSSGSARRNPFAITPSTSPTGFLNPAETRSSTS